MAVCPDFALQMTIQSSGWQTSEGTTKYKKKMTDPFLLSAFGLP